MLSGSESTISVVWKYSLPSKIANKFGQKLVRRLKGVSKSLPIQED